MGSTAGDRWGAGVLRTAGLTIAAMVAFAANSLLCRLALRGDHMDAASFTLVRIGSALLVLWLILGMRRQNPRQHGNWWSGLALFAYAAGFSFAYTSLPAAAGALLLFGAVQATMIGYGLWRGERLRPLQTVGLIAALGGVVGLLLPGLTAPPLAGSLLMIAAGMAWGAYSLLGRRVGGNPTAATGGNFLRALPMTIVLTLASLPFTGMSADAFGVACALASGALASGLGYAVWYSALPGLKATSAASIQLSVPIIAALGGTAFLNEALSARLVYAAVAVLGGIALVIWNPQRGPKV